MSRLCDERLKVLSDGLWRDHIIGATEKGDYIVTFLDLLGPRAEVSKEMYGYDW